MYTVHMKRVTATEARKNWFRLLDEVADGEVVLIDRGGSRLVLKLAESGAQTSPIPSYEGLIRVRKAEEADRWGWEWEDSPEGLKPRPNEPEA